MKIKILGYGEVGQSIHKLLRDITPNREQLKIYAQDINDKFEDTDFNFILVCIPYSDKFVQILLEEQKYCKKMIVFSTVPIGTLVNVPNCCHIPIEGRHPNLKESLKAWKFYVGLNEAKYLNSYRMFLELYMNKKGNNVVIVDGTRITEALKLLSTLNYGVNIEFARYVNDILTMRNYGLWSDYTNSYNELYKYLYGGYLVEKTKGSKEFEDMRKAGFETLNNIKRYNLMPPIGDIGGHCVRENAKMLDSIFSDIVKYRYNDTEKQEVSEDDSVNPVQKRK